jgi:hypothetical protein
MPVRNRAHRLNVQSHSRRVQWSLFCEIVGHAELRLHRPSRFQCYSDWCYHILHQAVLQRFELQKQSASFSNGLQGIKFYWNDQIFNLHLRGNSNSDGLVSYHCLFNIDCAYRHSGNK